MNADTVPSVSALKGIPLAELAELPPGLLLGSLGRALPDSSDNPVPVAAFQSAI